MALALAASSCALWTFSGSAIPQQEGLPSRVIMDSSGTLVEVPLHADRVVALRAGIVEALIVLGEGDRIVGVDDGTRRGTSYDELNVLLEPRLLNISAPVAGNSVNLEQLMALEADIVLAGGYSRTAAIDQMRRANITVAVVHFEELESFGRDLRIIGTIVGREEEAAGISSYLQGVIDFVSSKVSAIPPGERKRVYFCGYDIYHAYSGKTFEHSQIVAAGGIDVAENITGYLPQVSPEQIVAWDPEVIFTLSGVDIEALMQDPKVGEITAIKNGQVYCMPEPGWDYGSMRSVLAVEWMASRLYPERFADVDMMEVADRFYQQLYGIGYGGPPL